MGYRCINPRENIDDSEFRLMEVVMIKKSTVGNSVSSQVVIIDNCKDTLRHVQENWNEVVENIIQVKKMEERDSKKVSENEEIFGKGLKPLFSRISESRNKNLLANLSKSLKKALLLMAMERFSGDKDAICKVLGIDREKLDTEMNFCGLDQVRKAA